MSQILSEPASKQSNKSGYENLSEGVSSEVFKEYYNLTELVLMLHLLKHNSIKEGVSVLEGGG